MTDAGSGAPVQRRSRRGYLDGLRGLAVLVMIEAHLIDSWTRVADRHSREFAWAMIVGGFGAPLFLFLAGVAVPMSAGSKFRRSGDADASARAVARRGLEVFGLGFLFRVQAWILGWGPARSLLKVDILNIMGPSIVVAALLWQEMRTTRGRFLAFALATAATTFLTPIVRTVPILGGLPDPLEAYIRPAGALSNFVFFPWAGFVFAGALVGLALDEARTPDREARTNVAFAVAGVAIFVLAYTLSFLPTPYPSSHFWTTSPAFFFIRIGILTATVAAFYAWQLRPGGEEKWSPLQQLGRTSLFIYWIHVEMIYGLISMPLHQNMTLRQAWVALGLFSVFMLICSILKDRVMDWWNHGGFSGRRQSRPIQAGRPTPSTPTSWQPSDRQWRPAGRE